MYINFVFTVCMSCSLKAFSCYFKTTKIIVCIFLYTDSGEQTYTLSEAIEKLGFGKFQIKITLMVGFFVVSRLSQWCP